MSSCFILSSSEPNLVLEQIVSALWTGTPEHGGERGQCTPARKCGGKGQKVPSYVGYWFYFFIFPSCIHSSLRLDLLLTSGFYGLPWNAKMVRRKHLWKVTLKFQFWRHSHVIIGENALFQTSSLPTLLVLRRLCLWTKVLIRLIFSVFGLKKFQRMYPTFIFWRVSDEESFQYAKRMLPLFCSMVK